MNLVRNLAHLVMVFLLASTAWSSEAKKLEADLARVSSSIELTKKRIKSAQEIEFLPDLYFMLGELLVDKAKISYSLKKEKNPGVPNEELDFASEKQIRLEAIENYRLIEERYPQFPSLDKVLYTQGQEFLQLNDSDSALKTFKKIVDRFPKSSYFPKALVEIGNIFFEKKDYDFALEQYRKVIGFPGASSKKEMAHFKSGWCFIHKGEFLNSMLEFDKVFKSMKVNKVEAADDIREEALVASVWPISELSTETSKGHKEFLNPISYYRSVSYDKAVFRRVLNRLAKRMVIKNRPKDSYLAYLELFRLSDDLDEKKEAMENFYLKGKEALIATFPLWVAEESAKTLWLVKQEDVNRSEKKKELPKYEAFYRDFTTSMHKSAMVSKRLEDLRDVVQAYEKYIWIFPKTPYVADIFLNMAEASYHSKDYISGGDYYYKSAELTKDKNKRRELLDSAIQSYTLGFSNSDKLTNLEKMQGRAGFQKLATLFSRDYPNDSSLPTVKFNYAKSLYDEQNFSKAADEFRSFVKSYPQHELTEQAAILLIDSFYVRDDLQNVMKEGKAIEANSQLPSSLRSKMSQVVTQAQLKKVRSFSGEIGTKAYADKFLEFAKSSKGSNLSEPAHFEAFAALKAANDPRLFEIGEQYISQYGTQPRARDVLVDLSQKAMISADYPKAVKYFLAFGQRYKNDSIASEALSQAALLADQLGLTDEASQAYASTGQVKKAAEVSLKAQKWDELIRLGGQVSGLSGVYYQGLGYYRKGQTQEGMGLFRRVIQSQPSNDEEKFLQAHASIIVAENEIENFIQIGEREAFSVPLLQKKIQAYQMLDRNLQEIIGSGQGKWVIAALANYGKMNLHFSSFLKNSQPPAGMAAAQFQQMIGPQIANYSQAAKSAFDKCIVAAEDFEVFTRYVGVCRSQGQAQFKENLDAPNIVKASGVSNPEMNKLRPELVKTPRSVPLLRKFLVSALKSRDYAYAQAVAQRVIEIEPQSGQGYADLGVCQLYMEDWDAANASFTEAIKKDPRNSTALRGLAGLYKKFSFSKKFKAINGRAIGAGPLKEPTHPIMN